MADYVLALSDAEVMRYRFMAERAKQDESAHWTQAGIVEGATVADVGCGPGAISVVLAQLVGATGAVFAVDRDPKALDLARAYADAQGVTNVTFSEGGADASGLAPESVDVVMMRHVLAHNGGREQAIVDHLAILVRPGGTVYLVDIESTAARWVPADQTTGITNMLTSYRDFHTARGNDLSVGLRLGELLEAAGLVEVEHWATYNVIKPQPGMRPPQWAAREEMLAAGFVTEADITAWQAEFDRLDAGEFASTLFIPLFSAFGRKPS